MSRPRTASITSEAPDTPLGRLTRALAHHVSPIMVRSMIAKALFALKLREDQVTSQNLDRVAEEVMVGLRLFCEPSKLPDVMFEIAELCHAQTPPRSR